jgi:hypothetical protein
MKERIIRMYFADELRFNSDEQAREFYYALGRMCAFGANDGRPGLSVVNVTIDRRDEITGAFYPQLERVEGSYETNKKFYAIDDAFKPFITDKNGHVFVMGAIPRTDTENNKFYYSFHT